ncbi:histidinol-phosphate aminotransferase family protein [Patescibacteria group bacterium]|nr:histidinol-phosphate aminotransferase family protein [Patescibacteria group bacterium]
MKQYIINRNELFYPPSDKVKKAIKNFPQQKISRYIGGYYHSPLAEKISKKFNFPSQQILIFYGLEDFFRGLFRSLDRKKDSILVNQYHFAYFSSYLKHLKIKMYESKMVSDKNSFYFDIDDLIKKYKKYKPSIVLLTSPNNPTGNVLNFADLKKVLNTVSKNTLVILDEAYFGFDPNYQDKKYINLTKKYPHLMLVRTFSKFYGLAGLRIGYALAGKQALKIINYQAYYLNFSQILENIAIAALDSTNYYGNIAKKIIKDRDNLTEEINKLKNFIAYKSCTNFILIKVNKKILNKLKNIVAKQNFKVAMFLGEDMMRVSITLPKYSKRFLNTLKDMDNKKIG